MDCYPTTSRPPHTARGIGCALLAVALCALGGAGQRLHRAAPPSAPTALQPSPVAREIPRATASLTPTKMASATPAKIASLTPAMITPLTPSNAVWDFTAPPPSPLNDSAELNLRTRNAAAAFRRGQYQTVVITLRDALREFPQATAEARQSALSYLGASLRKLGRSADAENVLQTAIRLAPDTAEAAQARKWLRPPDHRTLGTF